MGPGGRVWGVVHGPATRSREGLVALEAFPVVGIGESRRDQARDTPDARHELTVCGGGIHNRLIYVIAL